VLWQNEEGGNVLRAILLPHAGPVVRSSLALTFVLGFLWLPSLVLGADLAIGVGRYWRERPPRAASWIDRERAALLLAITAGTIYLSTRYPTYSNARYMLPAYPLLLAMLLPAMQRLRMPAAARRSLLAATVVLLAASVDRTVDPVSRALWETFRVGRHDLLRVTSLTDECCGAGRDQLAYNLQFTAFDGLAQAALARVQPVARGRTLGLSAWADWYVIGPLDGASRRRLAPAARDSVPIVNPELPPSAQPAAPDSVWYLALPYVDDAAALAALRRTHTAASPDTVRAGGYAMAVWPFVRAPAPPPRAPE
jgi:hypothetical protein